MRLRGHCCARVCVMSVVMAVAAFWAAAVAASFRFGALFTSENKSFSPTVKHIVALHCHCVHELQDIPVVLERSGLASSTVSDVE
jgi:hypothetical protein